MRSLVGLNKQVPSQAYMRVLASGMRGFHAGTYPALPRTDETNPQLAPRLWMRPSPARSAVPASTPRAAVCIEKRGTVLTSSLHQRHCERPYGIP